MRRSVLMIVTSHSSLGSTGKATGFYLPELVHPYEVLVASGCDIGIASPKGGDAPIDPESIEPGMEKYRLLSKNTKPLYSIKPGDFDAYLVVGGHGTMWDLAFNTDLNRILPTAYALGKVIAAVCHGPVALTHLRYPDGTFMIRNKRVTGFSNDEESEAGLAKVVPFLLEDELIKTGATYTKRTNWAEHVVVDGNLITGQNPASAIGVGEAVASLLGIVRRANVLAG